VVANSLGVSGGGNPSSARIPEINTTIKINGKSLL